MSLAVLLLLDKERQETDMGESRSGTLYRALKEQVAALGLVRPGSLVKRHVPCGNPRCACMGDPPRLHGPYWQWSRKVKGTTVTLRLTEDQARRCAEWVRNHRQLKKLVRRMEALSLKETDRVLRTISPS
jgi:hypothetical protein